MTGTGALIRLILRRDRLILPVWIVVTVLVPYGVASGAASLYTTPESLLKYAEEAMANTAQVAMRGVVYAPTLGGVTAWGAGMSGALVAALASLLVVIRHTRTEEETGRRELLGSTVVGRHAGLAATLVVVLGANLVAAVLLAGAMTALGLPVAGSFMLGLSTAGVGVAMGAVAAVAAQCTTGSGAARGLAFAALAVLFLVRGVGDARGSWLSWASPFGWARLSLAYTGDRWWVLVLFAGFSVALVWVAYLLAARRDLAAGLLPDRAGPGSAAAALRSPFALAWRSHRGPLLAWTAGCAAVGALLGSAVDGAQQQISGLFSGADALFTFSLLVLSQAVSGYAISAALRPRAEERDGLAELLLAAAPARVRWAMAHLAFAVAGPALMLAVTGVAMGLTYGAAVGDVGGELPALLGTALLWLPAVWVMAALATALLGLLPRVSAAVAWGLLGVFLLVELAFEFGQVNEGVLGLSPFSHIPRTLLGAPLDLVQLVALLALALALAGAGMMGLRRRDITA
ncbi:ABC transporter permease [Nonomuraea insulae]|uniref:ABC transporter permease n=1 Tax=Nonomuraea insulae TaxID=1616787 RepID=A0ABW1CLF2_9ACTN